VTGDQYQTLRSVFEQPRMRGLHATLMASDQKAHFEVLEDFPMAHEKLLVRRRIIATRGPSGLV
jgi:hypothetical protein